MFFAEIFLEKSPRPGELSDLGQSPASAFRQTYRFRRIRWLQKGYLRFPELENNQSKLKFFNEKPLNSNVLFRIESLNEKLPETRKDFPKKKTVPLILRFEFAEFVKARQT